MQRADPSADIASKRVGVGREILAQKPKNRRKEKTKKGEEV